MGAPGSGKTTYCYGLKEFLNIIGRDVAIVNLDPANDSPPHSPEVDIADLVSLD